MPTIDNQHDKNTPAPAEALSTAPWVIVALYPDGRVCAASMLGYANEAEFRAECKGLDILIVPGPIALGEPLTPEQENAAVFDRDAALHERAALRARAEAAEAALKVATAGLKHIASLAARKQRDALTEFAESGHYASTTYEELMQEYETLKRPSEIAHEALAKSQPAALGSPS